MSRAPRSAGGQLTITAFVVSSVAVQIQTQAQPASGPASSASLQLSAAPAGRPGWPQTPVSLLVQQANGDSGSFSVLASVSSSAPSRQRTMGGSAEFSNDPERPTQITTTAVYGGSGYLLPSALTASASASGQQPTVYLIAVAN